MSVFEYRRDSVHTHMTVAVLSAAAMTGIAQAQWVRQGPSPTDMHITGIDFVTPENGWVTASYGNWGGLFGTTDGGVSWHTVTINEVETFNAVQMLNASRGWAVGDALYQTSDAWNSWTRTDIPEEPVGNPNANKATQVQFIDENVGYLSTRPSLTFSYLYRTTSAGQSWDYVGRFDLESWRFIDADVGWAALEDHTFVRTNDGGQTWTSVPMPPSPTIGSDVLEVFSYDHAVVTTFQDLETRYSIHQTTDGGATWSSSAPGTPRDAFFVSPQEAYGFMQFGAPAISTDGGMTWSENFDAEIDHEYFTAVDVVGDSVFLGGEYGFIAASHDLGDTWSQISNGTGNDLYRVGFADANHGWATGSGTILRTTDAGDTWLHQPGPVLTPFQALFTTGPADVYAFGPDHASIRWNYVNIITTTDGGASWTLEDQTDSWPGGRIYVLGPGVYIKFDFDQIHRSIDSGATWSSVNASIPYNFDAGDTIYDFYFRDDLNGWIIGGPNLAFRTQNGGLTWERTPDIARLPLPVYRRVRFATPDDGWIIGSYGLILHTTDGGATWQEQSLPGTFGSTYTDLVAVSASEAYVCGHDEQNRDVVLHTSDAGATWNVAYEPGLAHPFTFFQSSHNGLAVADGNVWAVGIWGGIVHARTNDCIADLAEPFGLLDFSDVVAFLTAFGAMAPEADLSEPLGQWDFSDVAAFLTAFGAGCP